MYMPEAIYCCFTRTTLFTELFTCLLIVAITSSSFITPHLLVSEIAKCIVYCCLTRTTLFTTMFIVVCSLKGMCVPSFIFIGCCVSELHGHLCAYRNVWPEAVYCCFTRTTLFTELSTCFYDQS